MQNQIVELTQAETEQVEGGFIPVLWGAAAVVSFAAGYSSATLVRYVINKF